MIRVEIVTIEQLMEMLQKTYPNCSPELLLTIVRAASTSAKADDNGKAH